MRKSWISAAAVVVAMAVTTPAMAEKAAEKGKSLGVASAAAATQAGTAAKPTKYCMNTEATGSRMLRKSCQTAEQWAAQGVDLERELKRSRR